MALSLSWLDDATEWTLLTVTQGALQRLPVLKRGGRKQRFVGSTI